jgi:hypothetical protein
LGADVIVTEIDPVKGIEAVMDGFPRYVPWRTLPRKATFLSPLPEQETSSGGTL